MVGWRPGFAGARLVGFGCGGVCVYGLGGGVGACWSWLPSGAVGFGWVWICKF